MTSNCRTNSVDNMHYSTVVDDDFVHQITLPNTWVDVKGHAVSNNVQLMWTIDEVNNQRFEVERSVNSSDFVRIATVASKGNGRNSYCYLASSFITGRNYYRLKHIDQFGIISYSKVITVNVEKKSLVSINETIVTSQLKVTVNNENKGTLMIADGTGKNLYKATASAGTNYIATGDLNKGVYHLIYFNGEHDVETFRFMKQ